MQHPASIFKRALLQENTFTILFHFETCFLSSCFLFVFRVFFSFFRVLFPFVCLQMCVYGVCSCVDVFRFDVFLSYKFS